MRMVNAMSTRMAAAAANREPPVVPAPAIGDGPGPAALPAPAVADDGGIVPRRCMPRPLPRRRPRPHTGDAAVIPGPDDVTFIVLCGDSIVRAKKKTQSVVQVTKHSYRLSFAGLLFCFCSMVFLVYGLMLAVAVVTRLGGTRRHVAQGSFVVPSAQWWQLKQ